MASLVAKKKGNKLYYYVVESARVDGKPRIVHQAYLGTAEKLAELVRDRLTKGRFVLDKQQMFQRVRHLAGRQDFDTSGLTAST